MNNKLVILLQSTFSLFHVEQLGTIAKFLGIWTIFLWAGYFFAVQI